MSMISSLIDELRMAAQTYRDLGNYETEQLLLDAADTIWQLRDDLQRANAENAKLREERDMYRDLVGCMVHPDIPDQLQAENARLRELVRDMCKAFIHGPCYRWCEHMPEPCNGDKCQYVRRMHELGEDA